MKDSKNIENHLISLMNGNFITDKDVYVDAAKSMIDIFKSIGINTFEKTHKPKTNGKKLTYGRKGSEPKTDIFFINNKQEYRLSIKKNSSAYIVSCNSPEDFIEMFINIFDGKNELDEEMLSLLYQASTKIGKISNFYSFDRSYKGDVESFVKDKFLPRASKYLSNENCEIYSKYIIDCYNNLDMKNEYIKTLHESESFLQNTIKTLFVRYPEYSKKIIFEFITGKIKFKNGDCTCDCLIDDKGFYVIDDYKCEYVNITYDKFINGNKISLLQNVPRKKITKKGLLSGNLDLIARDFSVADLTFKL
jgi:hypothetical protein